MKKVSAGILLYRKKGGNMQVLLLHHGGPFWQNKDDGYWTIPRGGVEEGESEFDATKREFEEETSFKTTDGTYMPLGTTTNPSGKIIHAWAIEGDCDPSAIKSNTTIIEWPPRSGKSLKVPEIDRGDFFTMEVARRKLAPPQIVFLERLETKLMKS